MNLGRMEKKMETTGYSHLSMARLSIVDVRCSVSSSCITLNPKPVQFLDEKHV